MEDFNDLRGTIEYNHFFCANHFHLMFFSPLTIAFNGFSMVWGSFNHWIQWFSMVMDHWSNDAMVSMDRSPLSQTKVLYLYNYLGELNYGILCNIGERDRDRKI